MHQTGSPSDCLHYSLWPFHRQGGGAVYGRDNLQVFHLLNLAALVLAKTLTNLLFGKGSFVTLTLARQVPSVLTNKDVFISTKIN